MLVAGLLVSGLPIAEQLAAQNNDKASAEKKVPERFKPRLTLVGHSARVHSVLFSPDGKLLISAAAKDPALKIWDAATGKEVRTILAVEGGFGRPVFSPDGKSLAAVSDGAVRIWDVATWEEKTKLKDSSASNVVFSPDGKVLAGWDGIYPTEVVLKLWDTKTWKELGTLKENDRHMQSFSAAAFAADRKTLVLGGWPKAGDSVDQIRLWNWIEKKPIGTLKTGDGNCRCLAFTRDGKTLLTLNTLGELTFWDFKDSRETKTLKLGAVGAFALSPDEKIVAATRMVTTKKDKYIHYSGDVDLWDTASGKKLITIPMETGGMCPAFSPKGDMLAVGCAGKFKLEDKMYTVNDDMHQPEGGLIRVWNLRDLGIRAKE